MVPGLPSSFLPLRAFCCPEITLDRDRNRAADADIWVAGQTMSFPWQCQRWELGELQYLPKSILPPLGQRKEETDESFIHPLTPGSDAFHPILTLQPGQPLISPLFCCLYLLLGSVTPSVLKFPRVKFRGVNWLCQLTISSGTKQYIFRVFLLFLFNLILSTIHPYCYIMVNLIMFFRLSMTLPFSFWFFIF